MSFVHERRGNVSLLYRIKINEIVRVFLQEEGDETGLTNSFSERIVRLRFIRKVYGILTVQVGHFMLLVSFLWFTITFYFSSQWLLDSLESSSSRKFRNSQVRLEMKGIRRVFFLYFSWELVALDHGGGHPLCGHHRPGLLSGTEETDSLQLHPPWSLHPGSVLCAGDHLSGYQVQGKSAFSSKF